MYRAIVTPHWFANNTRFWYRNDLRDRAKEFILVDVEAGTRKPAFDHAKLATSLSNAAGTNYPADKLPFSDIAFADDNKAVQFKVGDTSWKCDLSSYTCTRTTTAANSPPTPPSRVAQPVVEEFDHGDYPDVAPLYEDNPDPLAYQQRGGQRGGQGRGGQFPGQGGQPRSPDRKWTAFVRDYNVFVREGDNGPEVQLSQDGQQGNAYGSLQWAPDSKTLVAMRIEPGERKEVHLIRSSPPGLDPIRGGRAVLESRGYPLPGDKFTANEINLFDPETKKQTKPAVDRIDFGNLALRWKVDGHRFTYQKVDRGHQRFRIIEIDTHTGQARSIIDEQTKTFIWTAHPENGMVPIVRYLDDTDEIIWASEKDGYRHLYLVDAKEGKVKNAITSGDYCVRAVDDVVVGQRQIWFRAGGKNPGQDPYLVHHYRVNFDGTGLTALTEGNGNHSITYFASDKYIIDTYSRVDLPPVNELRRVSDGKLVCKLEDADVSELKEGGWEPPEVIVAKGRDGKTDIYGFIVRPRNLDPNKRYPIIEDIYAGPQGGASGMGGFVPKTFSAGARYTNYTNMGFIVAKVDGMGLPGRSKAFHDVCWQNLKDAGFPDRILWHKSIAAKYPYYDISRVGITGGSAGGQNAMGAVLFHPDFYKAAVAICGCHDNRMDKASWNEQWMGYPVGPQYAECSNVDNAHRLQGHVLLMVGEMDTNVPPESTYRVVDALIKANKDFDLMVIPGGGHGQIGNVGSRKRDDFFAKHLLGIDPPNRNAGTGRGRGGN
jgi:dipeptidyl aminopeptidase/acylaminoacyl peptidase